MCVCRDGWVLASGPHGGVFFCAEYLFTGDHGDDIPGADLCAHGAADASG